jgi:hypothetical protein
MATIRWWKLVLWVSIGGMIYGVADAQQRGQFSLGSRMQRSQQRSRNFLSERGLSAYGQNPAEMLAHARIQDGKLRAEAASSGNTGFTSPWTSVGPSPIQTSTFGFVSGRVTSIAVDPSDTSGNTVYAGTTGGGVWKSTNAAGLPGSVTFAPLTDTLPISSSCTTPDTPSLSIGALTVQPGGTGVVLAGTGDPNDALDSYYGMGILRSTNGGQTWCMIPDAVDNLLRKYSFLGEGIAGFAWSTVNPQLVVTAVAESPESIAVNAKTVSSFAGLYYSSDAGQTWHLATITDGPGQTIQSPESSAVGSSGNSATSVTWNPIRKRFYAAVRYHGYYESSDGITWTRLQNQPGTGLFQAQCPALFTSVQCPVFRGTIVSQPVTGDLFAITVDSNDVDQGLWRDVCNANGNGCASSTVTFSQQIADAAIASGSNGKIPQGDYDLSLAAVPAQQDTLLFVGAKDLYKCSLLNGCAWRNTTNTDGCASAQVAPSQHAIETTFSTNGLMYFGTDGGLWRTTDAVNQQQSVCSSDDAAHFQNLNRGLGSIAEVGAFSVDPQTAGVMMAAMGAFGTAASSNNGTWMQVLDGEGDYNAIDPQNSQNWYTTSASPVSINYCSAGTSCNKAGFGLPVIGNSQVGNDGDGMSVPAPWILDPQDTSNIIVGTCRVWRGIANGQGWTQANLLSNPLDNDQQNSYCNGNAQVRSLAASGGTGPTEKIYAGMAGFADGGATIAGHLYAATVSATGGIASWSDLSQSPLINAQIGSFNPGGFDVSSIYVDPHDPTGNTVYITLQGFITAAIHGVVVYRTVDGGAHWIAITDNLPNAPANSILVDPNDANTVYVALDTGVYATRNINQCTDTTNACWSHLGSGLPYAPVTQLKYVNYGSTQVLLASTYGRGIWQIPLLTAGTQPATGTLTPPSLVFAAQKQNTFSSPQTITVTNTGTFTLTITSVSVSQNFSESDNCAQPLAPGQACNVQVSFAPEQTGTIQGVLTVYGNLPGGQITASLSGTGLAPGNVQLLPGSLNFGSAVVGTTTSAQNITISNTGGVSINLQPPVATGDFHISANTCGGMLPPNTGCTAAVVFAPTASGTRSGTFSITDDSGTQSVQLTGTGQTQATMQLSASSLSFPTPITIGTTSNAQMLTLTNTGDVALLQIKVGVQGDFLAENNCSALLAGHNSCVILVTFAPKQVGTENGTLYISTALGTQTVALSGTGLAPPGVSLLPSSIDFGGQGLNITSSRHPVTLTNSGGSPLTGLIFAVTGDFAIADNTCPSNKALDVGSACTLDLTFTPTQTRLRSGTLTVSAANLSVPFTTPLSGTGEDFSLGITGQISQVIVSGQSAAYSVQISSIDGSSGAPVIGCSNLPSNATCASSLAPGAMLTSGGMVTATVTIHTGTGTSDASVNPFVRQWQAMALAASSLLPWLFLGKRKRHGWIRFWCICFLSITMLAAIACGTRASGGSGSGPGTPPGGTPSNVYTINITATLAGLTKSAPVKLTVQ